MQEAIARRSIIQFLHELPIHAISHTRVSQSPIPLLTSFFLLAGQISEKGASDAACDVPACSGAWGTFSSLLPCSSTYWGLFLTRWRFFKCFFFFPVMHAFRITSIFQHPKNVCIMSPWFQDLKWNSNKQPKRER